MTTRVILRGWRKWRATPSRAWLMALSLAACTETARTAAPTIETREQHLNGGVTFATDANGQFTCTQTERTLLTAAMTLLGQEVTSPRFVDCLREVFMTNSPSNFAELATRVLQDNYTTIINCANLNGAEAEAGPEVGREYLTYNHGSLVNTTAEHVAGVILHEIGHNKMYAHWSNPWSREYRNSGNELFNVCSIGANRPTWPFDATGAVFLGNPVDGGTFVVSPGRSFLSRETELNVVGYGGGTIFDQQCSMDAMVNGIDVTYDGVHITSLATSCQSPFGSTGWWNMLHQPQGSGGGTATSLRCAANEVAVGMVGGVNEWLVQIGLYCAPRDTWRNLPHQTLFQHNFAGAHLVGQVGESSPTFPWVRGCPTGMALKSIRGSSGTRIDRMELTCQAINRDLDVKRDWLARVGTPTSLGDGLEFCAGHSVLTGMSIATTTDVASDPNKYIERLGGFCETVTWDSNERLARVGEEHFLEAHGGGGYPGHQGATFNNEMPCGPGEALVGLNVRVNSSLSAIQGLCAATADWSNLALPTVATNPLAEIGGTSGTVTQLLCNRGAYLNGWAIGEAGTPLGPITDLQPICRTFTLAAPGYAPTNLTATGPGGDIQLTWNPAPEASSYVVRRSTSSAGPFTDIATNLTTTSYLDTVPTPWTTYFYVVAGANTAGVGPASDYIGVGVGEILPVAPTGLAANAVSSNRVDLSWTDNSINEIWFLVERATASDGPFTQVGSTAANVMTYSDTTVVPGTTYHYRVRAYNNLGGSAYTNTAVATPPASAPAAPSDLTATAVTSVRIDLTWLDHSNNETGFSVERATASDGPFTPVGSTAADVKRYMDATLESGVTYFFRVRAYNDTGNSTYSNTASATTLFSPLQNVFESAANWTTNSGSLSTSNTASQGSHSIAHVGGGCSTLNAPRLATPAGVTSTVAVDLRIPSPQPNPYWLGLAQLYITLPSQGVNNQYVGQVELTGRPIGSFITLNFTLPASLVEKLRATYTDLTITLALNVPYNSNGAYLFDNLRFVP